MHKTSEENQSLWLLTLSPGLWMAHFLLSYLTASIGCAKFGDRPGSFDTVRLLIVGYTLVALIGIGVTAWIATRRYQHGENPASVAGDTAADRHRFLGHAAWLLSIMSFVAVVFGAMVVLFFRSCD